MKYGYTFWHVWEIWTSKVKCAHFLLMTDSHNDIIICFLSLLIFHLIHLHVQTWFSFAISHFTGLLCLFIYIWKTINKAYILFWEKVFFGICPQQNAYLTRNWALESNRDVIYLVYNVNMLLIETITWKTFTWVLTFLDKVSLRIPDSY